MGIFDGWQWGVFFLGLIIGIGFTSFVAITFYWPWQARKWLKEYRANKEEIKENG